MTTTSVLNEVPQLPDGSFRKRNLKGVPSKHYARLTPKEWNHRLRCIGRNKGKKPSSNARIQRAEALAANRKPSVTKTVKELKKKLWG